MLKVGEKYKHFTSSDQYEIVQQWSPDIFEGKHLRSGLKYLFNRSGKAIGYPGCSGAPSFSIIKIPEFEYRIVWGEEVSSEWYIVNDFRHVYPNVHYIVRDKSNGDVELYTSDEMKAFVNG